MSRAPGSSPRSAKAAGASALVHVSAIGADPWSTSDYGRTKGEGEAAVRGGFAEATIVRPSLVFGPEDQLTNRFAALGRLPLVPVLAPKTRFQPVYVLDLGEAIAEAALGPRVHGGKTYEIGGPEILSMLELHRAIYALTGQDPDLVELPHFAGNLIERLWLPPRRAADPRPVDHAAAGQCRGPRTRPGWPPSGSSRPRWARSPGNGSAGSAASGRRAAG